jgi:hypothetical protein
VVVGISAVILVDSIAPDSSFSMSPSPVLREGRSGGVEGLISAALNVLRSLVIEMLLLLLFSV